MIKDWDRFNLDWVPTLHLGHSKQHVKDPEEATAQKAANRCKRQVELAEKRGKREKTADEIFYKAKPKVEALNVDDTGKTADEILYKAEPEAEALNVDDKDPETREELCSSHDQKTVYAETQTTKFEYLSKDKSVLVWKKTTIIIVCFEENIALYQAQLAIPAFTRGRNQLGPLDVKQTRGIANVRVHVEHGILPIDYLTCSEKSGKIPLIDGMIRVCAALTNLAPSVVPFE
ncbi:unnamed protein product [Pocillopora meandrina]|uniref:DDE Tnp4 domain-containing protein n=1 Tax=Pocillopora meandrina TaxID=46732 RepID=A0AAU9VNA9_9CNID|nr:unnamed protein product [Pocillopora meandrina]